jgi:hypothetical protein
MAELNIGNDTVVASPESFHQGHIMAAFPNGRRVIDRVSMKIMDAQAGDNLS